MTNNAALINTGCDPGGISRIIYTNLSSESMYDIHLSVHPMDRLTVASRLQHLTFGIKTSARLIKVSQKISWPLASTDDRPWRRLSRAFIFLEKPRALHALDPSCRKETEKACCAVKRKEKRRRAARLRCRRRKEKACCAAKKKKEACWFGGPGRVFHGIMEEAQSPKCAPSTNTFFEFFDRRVCLLHFAKIARGHALN
jgi:hypothetical protein